MADSPFQGGIMHADVCQTDKVAQAKIASICKECSGNGFCIWQHHAASVAAKEDAGMHRQQVIDSCSFFRDVKKDSDWDGDQRPALFEAGVHDLCGGCPSSLDRSCGRRRELDAITRISLGYPGWVHVSIVTCKPKGNGLYQISDPRK
jgi:hypothetical protein